MTAPESIWTLESLKEHFDARLADKDLRDRQRFEAKQQSTRDALAALDQRLAGMNELRAALSDRDKLGMPRTEIDAKFDALRSEIAAVKEKFRNEIDVLKEDLQRRRGMSDGWKLFVGVVGFVATVLTIVAVVVTIGGR